MEQKQLIKCENGTWESTLITCGASRLVSNWTPSSDEKEFIGDNVLKYQNQWMWEYFVEKLRMELGKKMQGKDDPAALQ